MHRMLRYDNKKFLQVKRQFYEEEEEREEQSSSEEVSSRMKEGYYKGNWRFKYLVVLRNPARVALSKVINSK
jgi:hypothetical protein